jgi:hypothetical protein
MWYLPVVDRLRRMFLNPKKAALMTWWDDDRKVGDGKIGHPTGGSRAIRRWVMGNIDRAMAMHRVMLVGRRAKYRAAH